MIQASMTSEKPARSSFSQGVTGLGFAGKLQVTRCVRRVAHQEDDKGAEAE
jgi:hypothetical protein